MKPKGRIRATDVAKEAGVSTATVSYVLNNTPGQKISEATAKRVRDAAKRLGYVSNTAAQTLARGRSAFVLLDMSDFLTQESATLAATAFLNKIRDIGYEPFMTWWPSSLEGITRHDRLIRFARATNPQAVISVLPLKDDAQTDLRAMGVPSLSSIVESAEELVPALALPAQTQVEYLMDQGHRHILYAASSHPTLDHLAEVRNAMGAATAHGRGGRWTALPRYERMADLARAIDENMARHPEATAIAAYNDSAALTVLFALHYLQVDVPGRMAVIGIDNDFYDDLADPRLTSVAIGFEPDQIDAELLVKGIEGGGSARLLPDPHHVVRTEVVIRESA